MDTNNMHADRANIAVTNYSESENVCFVCRRNSKASIETTSLTLENIKLFFECCSKYHWPDPLQKCFQRNLNEQGNNCDLCTDCLSSLEKILEMYQLLEEMQNGIQNFIDLFANQVLDYQSQAENHEDIPSKETPGGNSFFEDTCLENSQAIEKIEVGLEIEQFVIQTGNDDDSIDIKDESVTQIIENTNYYENNTDSSPSNVNIDIDSAVNDNEDIIENESSKKGLSLLQEQKLICNYNSTNLGTLCPLKNLKVVLKRIEITNEEEAPKMSNDCVIPTDTTELKCHICQRVFPRQSNLTRHISIHKRDDANFQDENSLHDSTGNKIIVTRGKRKAAETAMKKLENLERTISSCDASDTETNYETPSDPDSDSEYCSSLESIKEDDCDNEGVKHKIFHCKICKKNFPGKYSLKRHIHKVHNPRDKIKRTICQKIIQTKYSFDEHLLTHKKTRFNKNTVRMTSLKRYVGNVHNFGNRKTARRSFQCNICRKTFPRKDSLDRHLFTHPQNNQYMVARRFKCTACKFSCNFTKQLTTHNSETGHLNNEAFKCTSCSSVFTKLKDLSNHNVKMHYDKVYKCLICPKRFARRRNLTKHHLLHRQNSFKCETCDKTFSRKSVLTRHTSNHTQKLLLYKCTICTKTFQWKISLNDHLHVHNVGKFKCDTCGKEFLNKRLLHQHRLFHNKIQVKRLNQCYKLLCNKHFTCRMCKFTFLRKENLKRHHLMHKRVWGVILRNRRSSDTTEEEYNAKLTSMNLFECDICEKVFAKWYTLSLKSSWKQHRDSAHKNKKYCECKTCGKLFYTNEQLQNHKNLYNNEKDIYHCDVCKENFHTQFDFDVHKNHLFNCEKGTVVSCKNLTNKTTKSSLTSLGSFECKICPKIFQKRKELNRHRRIHEKTPLIMQNHQYIAAKRFKCTTCKFSCNFIKQLTKHNSETGHLNSCASVFAKLKHLSDHNVKIHHGKLLKCLICPKRFARRRNLTRHHLLHRPNTLKCEICDETFLRKSILLQHTSTHTKKLSLYKCTICTETFQWKILLDDHLHVHNVGKFKCDTCGKEFLNKRVLHRHRLSHKQNQVKKLNQCHKLLANKKFQCRICRHTFLRREHLKKHHMAHKEIWGKIMQMRKGVETTQESFDYRLASMNLFECTICQTVFPKWPALTLKSCWKQHRDNIHKNKKYYECETCGKLFSNIEQLQHHKNLFTNEKETYQCDICKEYFHTQSDFEVHKNRHSNCQKGAVIRKKELFYECGVCDKVFNEKPLRRRHFKSHVATRLKCKMCNKSVDRKNFMSHWKDHTSPKDFKCDVCDLCFDGENKLSIHKMRVHSDERPYKCSICPKAFKFVANLTQHEEAIHLNTKLVCEFCGIILGSRKRYLDHRKRHTNTFYCKLCDRNYTSKSGLSLHNKTVHSKDGKKFQCEFCPKVFSSKQNCKSHMRVHMCEKPFACDKCNKKFKCKQQLMAHNLFHEGVKFPCKVCGKILNSKISLTSHVQLQHNNTIFQCEICGKKCKRKDNLITHMRSHNGEKPYQCQECGKSFTRLDNLNVHLKWHEKVKTLKAANKIENDESESSEED